MTSPGSRFPWLRAAAFGAAALTMVVAACEAPGPVQPAPVSVSMQPVRTDTRTTVEAVPSNVRISRAAIDAAVRQHYPEVFRAAATDTSTLMFVLAPGGEIERHDRVQLPRPGPSPVEGVAVLQRWRESTGLSEGETARSVVDALTFAPGQMGPGRVEVLWVRKFSPEDLVTTTTRTRVSAPAGQAPGSPALFRTGGFGGGSAQITAAQAREHVVRYLPRVAREGTTADFVWIMADAAGRVVGYGDSNDSEALNRRVGAFDDVQMVKSKELVFNGHEVALVYVRLKA